jgi:hypothetical protein
MRFLVIGGLLLMGGLGYAQAHIEARQRQALLDKDTTLEPAGGAPEPVQQSEPPSTMRRLSPALEKSFLRPNPSRRNLPAVPAPFYGKATQTRP